MSVEDRFKKRYKTGNIPWDIGKPDFNLTETVTQNPIKSCKVLDIGCGTGDNSIWLVQKHFQVTGTDIFEILSLTSSHFGSNSQNPPRCWACLTQKRDTGG
jgi:2-polyprenyl-3-methyl-5-hydroxy-6-metoxy-1,4-benzoquinol methylase